MPKAIVNYSEVDLNRLLLSWALQLIYTGMSERGAWFYTSSKLKKFFKVGIYSGGHFGVWITGGFGFAGL